MEEKSTQQKIEDAGKKMQSMGCALTILITIPIALTIFLGIPGFVIGSIVAVFGLVGILKKKD